MECDVYVFDYDGVLVYAGTGEPRRVGIDALLEATRIGVAYLVSGRPTHERSIILATLRDAGVPVSKLGGVVLRSRGSEAWHKLEAYMTIRDREGCIGEIHDDNPEVLYPARRLVERGLILHYDDHCEPLHGYSLLSPCKSR